jgi:hypothetical protein
MHHYITSDHHGRPVRYRYKINDARQTPESKVSAEYFSEKHGWLEVKNWNTRHTLYSLHQKSKGE